MADNPTLEGTYGRGDNGHLDASGPREVVYCHQCDNEWWRDGESLTCPRCQHEFTEIVTPDNDPRPIREEPPPHPLHNHNPWAGSDSDPEDADIEEHVTHGPGGSIFFTQTIRTSRPHGTSGNQGRRDAASQGDPDNVMAGFQNMLGSLMGPDFRAGQAGRSGPETLYPQNTFGGGGIRIGGDSGPRITGGRFTFTTGPLRPRNADEPQPADGARVDDLATYDSLPSRTSPMGLPPLVIILRNPPDQVARIVGSIFGAMAPSDEHRPRNNNPNRMPPGLEALFASILNAGSAHSGDAVYSQEALDQIISTLMEQHPTSNAPGPASPAAIAALPKKKLDEKMLGPEGKGECSVCMDDVEIGDEMALLPCSHWFHEACAGAWLSEHNTCPICRKGIEGDSTSPNVRRSSQTGSPAHSDPQPRSASVSSPRLSPTNTSNSSGRNEARLDAIRNIGRPTPAEEYQANRRLHVVGQPRQDQTADESRTGGYSTSIFSRPRDRDDRYESQRDTRGASHTSSSDDSRGSRRSSQSGGQGTGTGPLAWLRDRFGGNPRRHD
ncbi:uncharacterized protein BP5553_06363 [Venustampulla echinocandica]|uniref:RING-type E3 ubiquitin transferase n=1 Tax=Venustampulla echinocandica TaxID=2656787 RepID=A0A370TJP7_9HELO|nr:uncharacterized protein BP5553_06363 [Venustampulla echinocandica]RDL35751.1 hypothetical protein BP5553_06363 [Venustampulla echinocandica]